MLEHAETLRRPGPYQLQAAIAAGHAQGSSPETLAAAYEALLQGGPRDPVARLNHAVAVATGATPKRGLELVDVTRRPRRIPGSPLGPGRPPPQARTLAKRRTPPTLEPLASQRTTGPERRFLERRLGETAALTPE